MNSNLDVWAIQTMPEALSTALDNINADNDIILYENVRSDFTLGDERIINRQFDTFLYSEENDILVMLMRGGLVNADNIREYLDKKGLKYHEVVFAKSSGSYKDNLSIPELWFAREEYVVEDAFKDSIDRGSKKEFEYYPFLTGNLSLTYRTDMEQEDLSFLGDAKDDSYPVDGRLFRGLIKLDDKIIILINQGEKRNVTASDIGRVAEKYGFTFTVLTNDDFNLSCIEEHKLIK